MAPVPEAVGSLLAEGRAAEAADVALATASRVEFLDVDITFVRVLQDVLAELPLTEHTRRSRVAARVAYELRGDASDVEARKSLLDLAADEAGQAGDDLAMTEALLARVHALWEPAGAGERLDAAEQVIALTVRTHDVEHELEARLARVQALVEVGRLQDAEFELAAFARLAAPLERPLLDAFLASRRAVLAVIGGRFDVARHQSELAYENAVAAGMPDAGRLRMVGLVSVELDRGISDEILQECLAQLTALAIRMPGHYFDTQVAWILLQMGRRDEARIELTRSLPSLLTTTGYRWLYSACIAGEVAAAVGSEDVCARLYAALLPHRDLLVAQGPAFSGAVADRLGVLATRLGRLDEAVEHLATTVAVLDEIAALPWAARARAHLAAALRAAGDVDRAEVELARALESARMLGMHRFIAEIQSAPSRAWTLRRDGGDWVLDADAEHGRFRAARGFDHLRALLANPHRDIAATELDYGGAPVERGVAVLDKRALATYRHRLAEIDEEVDAADHAGDQERSASLADERTQILAELRHATGLGGRARTSGDAAERARVNVTRNLKRALVQIQRCAPIAGAHLAASLHTGTHCRYEPTPGGPERWDLT